MLEYALRQCLHNEGANFENGDAMVLSERRRESNARLREQINQIQHRSEQLKSWVDDVQVQAVAWARLGKLTDLPDAALAQNLNRVFDQQRTAMASIRQEIRGAIPGDMRAISAALLSDEELAALLK